MKFSKWIYLFFTTMFIGGVGSVLLGLVLDRESLFGTGITNTLFGLIGYLGAGLLFSLIAQMGFFSYLAVHSFGLGFFRSLWAPVQVLLIAFTFFDMVYLRYNAFAREGESVLGYIALPAAVLVYALIVAYFKVKQTNPKGAVPTVFFMFVVTIVEWIPALNKNNWSGMIHMLVPLLLCNTWQVMQLHRLTEKRESPKTAPDSKPGVGKKKKAQ